MKDRMKIKEFIADINLIRLFGLIMLPYALITFLVPKENFYWVILWSYYCLLMFLAKDYKLRLGSLGILAFWLIFEALKSGALDSFQISVVLFTLIVVMVEVLGKIKDKRSQKVK